MTSERQLFEELLDLESEEARAAFLERIGRTDASLRDRLAGLLKADGEAGNFLNGRGDGGPHVRTEYSSLPRQAAEGPGSLIGRYKLLQKIGEGGFGVVYMAEQREPVKRRVALKIIKLGMDTRQVVGRFEAERQALAMMDHPNIAKVLDGGATENGRPYFVMELVRGVPVTEFCDENKLDTEERLRLFVRVCRALQHAHQKGIIHRDIKPGNVLVTMHDDRPVPKVIDFGIAKAMQQELTDITIFTRYQEFIGTPAYMSPEQAQFNGLDIDTRTDIYSLGVLLYELLTGSTPFDARELLTAGYEEIRRRIREEDPPKPSTRVERLTKPEQGRIAGQRRESPERLGRVLRGELDWIVMRSLEKDRTRRYDSVGALALDIERYLSNEPVAAAAPGAFYRLGKFVTRHRVVVGVAAVILVLLVVGVWATAYQMVRASKAETLALRYLNEERRRAAAMEVAYEERNAALNRAQREAAVSAAVVQFLNEDLFGEAAESNTGQNGLTVKELVQQAGGRVDERFSHEPLVAAGVRQALAITLFALGDEDGALEQAGSAFEVRREQLGATARETLESMILYGYLVSFRRDWQEGRELCEEAVRLATDAFGRSHEVTLDGMSRLARIYYSKPITKNECRELSAELVDLVRANPNVSPEVYIRALHMHGRMDNPGKGEAYFRNAVSYATEKLGPQHPRTISARAALAGYLYDWHIDLAEAERLCREAMQDYSRMFGSAHPNSLVYRDNLRLILLRAGKHAEAVYQGLKMLQISDGSHARLDLLRYSLNEAPLDDYARLSVSGRIDWASSPAVTGRDWSAVDFDDSTWKRNVSAAGTNLWIRGRFRLPKASTSTPVFVFPPEGEFVVYINGLRASNSVSARDAEQQILVPAERACRALRVGSNVFAIEARQVDPSKDLRFQVLALPEPGDEPGTGTAGDGLR